MARPCSAHPETAAAFRCEGCRRLLCAACVEEGHRLVFCRHCRERALPLDRELPASVPELARHRVRTAPYRLADAFLYPFRGLGRLTLPALALYLTVALLLAGFGRLAMLGGLLALLPGLLFEIARTSAEGERELPLDWPDLGAPFERAAEVARGLGVALVALAPAWAAMRLLGCDLEPYLRTTSEGACLALFYPALAAGLLLGVFAFGAAGAHASGWLVLRIDLHLEALFGPAGRDALGTALLLAGLFLGSRLAGRLLAGIPVLGAVTAAVVVAYALFVGAHLVGRLFLRHAAALDPLYREPV